MLPGWLDGREHDAYAHVLAPLRHSLLPEVADALSLWWLAGNGELAPVLAWSTERLSRRLRQSLAQPLANLPRAGVAALVLDSGQTQQLAGSVLELRAAPVRGLWDRDRLDQIVSNLLANAIKYGSGRPIGIEVSRADSLALLKVRDHGIGIHPRDQRRVFERFERAVSTRQFGGLGLGLWIVRQLVEGHGGTISVESAPEQGALFDAALPLRAEEPKAEAR